MMILGRGSIFSSKNLRNWYTGVRFDETHSCRLRWSYVSARLDRSITKANDLPIANAMESYSCVIQFLFSLSKMTTNLHRVQTPAYCGGLCVLVAHCYYELQGFVLKMIRDE